MTLPGGTYTEEAQERLPAGLLREWALEALRRAGDEGILRADLSNALEGRNPTSAVKQLRERGHRIGETEEIVGPLKFHTVRYRLVVDATPALFDIWTTDP